MNVRLRTCDAAVFAGYRAGLQHERAHKWILRARVPGATKATKQLCVIYARQANHEFIRILRTL